MKQKKPLKTLSDSIMTTNSFDVDTQVIEAAKAKEFIKDIKEDIMKSYFPTIQIIDIINKRAGERLI